MTPFERLKSRIFATESSGDYNALYNYANREGSPFAGFKLTGMTVDEALEFANPSGPYAQYVKGQVGRVATPMGAYQVVGSTLADAKKGLGLTGSEMMTEDLQDKIGQWIYKTQGPSAWEGLKGKDMATPMDRAREEQLRRQMLASGTAPQAAPRAPLSALRQDRPQAAAAPQQRRGGLGGIMDYLGKQSPTTGLSRAEQFAAALDPLIMPEMRAGEAIRARGTQRQAAATKNKTVEYLRRMGYNDYAQAVESGAIGAKDIMNALVSKSLETPKGKGQIVSAEQLRKMYPNAEIAEGLYNLKPDGTANKIGGGPMVQIGGGESEFLKVGQAELARNFAEMAQAGRDATSNLGRIKLLDELLDESGTGLSAGFLSRANQYFGVDFRSAPAAAAEAIISQLVPAQRPAGSGVISDADLALYKASLPAIQNQPNGNKLIVKSMVAITEHNAKVGRIASRALTDPNYSIQQAEDDIAALPDPFESVRGFLGGSGADIPAPDMTEREALDLLNPPSGG
jgi:hypothetical protein